MSKKRFLIITLFLAMSCGALQVSAASGAINQPEPIFSEEYTNAAPPQENIEMEPVEGSSDTDPTVEEKQKVDYKAVLDENTRIRALEKNRILILK